jgi:hypothetical protein
MRWTGQVALKERGEVYIEFWWGHPGVNREIILTWIFRKLNEGINSLDCFGAG